MIEVCAINLKISLFLTCFIKNYDFLNKNDVNGRENTAVMLLLYDFCLLYDKTIQLNCD